jgi:serine/threonine protein kinase
LALPATAFGDPNVDILRFDFTGTGSLKLNEAYKLVKFHLFEYRKYLGGAPEKIDIPFRTVKTAGYTITKKLGAGNQGTAYLANDADWREFCIKSFRKNQMNSGGLEMLKDEFEALRLLHCDSIAGAFEMFQDLEYVYLVGDAFYGGDLTSLHKRAQAQGIEMDEQWWGDLFKQLLEALTFMHKQAMIHCDIKEPNLMIKTADFRAPQAVVIDLGVARAMASQTEGTPHGTPGYVPPETWDTMKWFPSGDIFSLGVVMLQLLTRVDKIFSSGCTTIKEIRDATISRTPPLHLIPGSMPNLRDVTSRFLRKSIDDRPRSEEALKYHLLVMSVASPRLEMSKFSPRGSYPLQKIHPRNVFASQGITSTFVMNMGDSREDDAVEGGQEVKANEVPSRLGTTYATMKQESANMPNGTGMPNVDVSGGAGGPKKPRLGISIPTTYASLQEIANRSNTSSNAMSNRSSTTMPTAPEGPDFRARPTRAMVQDARSRSGSREHRHDSAAQLSHRDSGDDFFEWLACCSSREKD